MSSPAAPLMGPPARVGTKIHEPTTEIQPTTGTRPIREEVKDPVQHSPKRSGGNTVPQKQYLTPKSLAESPSSSKPKQVFPSAQDWIPISSEGDDHRHQINQQPQAEHKKKKISKQKKQKKTPSPDTDDVDDDSNSNSSRLSGRPKKQTRFYGSPVRHAVKEISQHQAIDPSPKTPRRKHIWGNSYLLHQHRKGL